MGAFKAGSERLQSCLASQRLHSSDGDSNGPMDKRIAHYGQVAGLVAMLIPVPKQMAASFVRLRTVLWGGTQMVHDSSRGTPGLLMFGRYEAHKVTIVALIGGLTNTQTSKQARLAPKITFWICASNVLAPAPRVAPA
jgi:hypothetical protein